LLSTIILPGALVITVLREPCVRVFFGEGYRESAVPLAVLAWGMFFAYTGAVYLNLFIVRRLQRLMVVVSVGTLAVNVVVNLWLIPRYGATGAAVATVVSNIFGYAVWALHPETAPFMAECTRVTARPLAGVALAWLVLAVTGADGLVAAAVAAGVYGGTLLLTGGVTRSDLNLLRRLVASESAA